MKYIFTVGILVLTFGFAKAQSNREDIEIQLPKTDKWELDKSSLIQTDFSHRQQKWYLKEEEGSEQKIVVILSEDITKNTVSFDSIYSLSHLSDAKGISFKLLKEKKHTPFPYKLISVENRKVKSEQTPISSLIYITDGKTCRHIVSVSVRKPKLSADFLKQWSEILLQSWIVPTKTGNFEYTDDASVQIKQTIGVEVFYIDAGFKSDQMQHLVKGQSTTIVIDNFPEISLSGKISEISKKEDTANKSQLTTPNTKSGSYIQITERVPVSIKVEIPIADREKFKSGMNCTVKVDTAP